MKCYEVSIRMVLILLRSARIQAAWFVPPQYPEEENTVRSLPFCWICGRDQVKIFIKYGLVKANL